MGVGDWTVEVRDPSRIRQGQLIGADLTTFVCVPRKNAVGSWSIELPETVLTSAGLRIPHAMCALLRQENAGLVVSGPNGQVLSGPMLKAVQSQSREHPHGVWKIEGVSDLIELEKPTAFPDPSIADPQLSSQSRANDTQTALGEALLRYYVDANIGPSAPVARQVAGLALAADAGLGVSLTKSPRFQNLLELLQEIALGSDLLFDLVDVGNGALEFQVSAVQDVSSSVRWDVENSQLELAMYGLTAPTCTRVFVAGQGEGTGRKIIEVTTVASLAAEAVWGRIERFLDQRQTDDDDELTQAGLEILAEEGFTGTALQVVPSSDMAAGFGSDWLVGSIVAVVVAGQELPATVSEVPILIGKEGVFVGASVGDVTGFDDLSVVSSRGGRTESRVSSLERNAEAAPVPPFIETRTVAYTTSSLADGATETTTLDLGAGFTILNFASSHALRFRAYQTAAHRTADAARAVGIYPSGDHGLIFEDDGAAVSDYATVAVGGLLDGETLCPVSITNRSGSTRAVTVTLEVRG